MIVSVHVFYPLFCALKNISILLMTVMIAVVMLKLVMMLMMVMVLLMMMMMIMMVLMIVMRLTVMLLLLLPVFMIAPMLFLQPLVVKILIIQSLLLPFLLFAGQAFALFLLLAEVLLPGVCVLNCRIIAGNELIPVRMERSTRTRCRSSARVIITILIATATTEMIAAMVIASVEASGTG